MIYETDKNDSNLKSAEFKNRPQDYKYAEQSELYICATFLRFSKDDFKLTEAEQFDAWSSLMKRHSMGKMQDVALDMVSNFQCGLGKEYSNDILNTEIANHKESKKYISSTTKIINQWINDNNGDISGIKYNITNRKNCIMPSKMRNNNVLPPVYDDKLGGLGICVDGIYGSRTEITSYNFDGVNYSYTIKYTLYDIFGLDQKDMEDPDRYNYDKIKGFRCWYILQHLDFYDGRYQPFITYMQFQETVKGKLQ